MAVDAFGATTYCTLYHNIELTAKCPIGTVMFKQLRNKFHYSSGDVRCCDMVMNRFYIVDRVDNCSSHGALQYRNG